MDKPEPLTPEEVQVLVDHIHELRAEVERLRSQQSLLGVLREIALDPSVPPHLRLKAAEAGVSFEQPKLSASVIGVRRTNDWGTQMDTLQGKDADSVSAEAIRERARRAREQRPQLTVIDGEPA